MVTLYVLKSKTYKRTYIGITHDISKRFREHNSGGVRSTKFYKPYDIVYTEEFLTKSDARKRELELKNSAQKKEILFKELKLP